MKGFRGWGGQAYEVGVGEHDAKILGCELSKDLESVRMRVRLNQRVGAVLATNEAEGIDEAAAFLGVPAWTLPGMPHDVMLNPGWEAAAEPLVGWYRGEFLLAEG